MVLWWWGECFRHIFPLCDLLVTFWQFLLAQIEIFMEVRWTPLIVASSGPA